MSLERQDADHGLVVVANVGAFGGARTARDPPESEQPDDMVDTDAAGVPKDGGDHVAEGTISGLGQPVGAPWWLGPVLTVLVVRIGRRADRHALGVGVLQAPRVGPRRMHSHRQVVHDAQTHPGAPRGTLDQGKLFVYQPLKPALELDLPGMMLAELGDRRRVWMPQLLRPLGKPCTMMRGQHGPGREVLQTHALTAAVRVEGSLPTRGARHREENGQRLALGLPRAVSVDRRSWAETNHQFLPPLVDFGPLVVAGQRVLRNSLD